MKTVIKGLGILAAAYTFGLLLGVIFCLMIITGRIRVEKWGRIPFFKGRVILVANHPSLLEPFLLPNLFFPEHLLFPPRLTPRSTPDRRNFYKDWYWFWLRPVAIPIDRGDREKQFIAFQTIKKVLEKRGRVIIFPEGARTSRGKDFYYKDDAGKIILGSLKPGAAALAIETGATIVPVWVELRLARMIIKVGKPTKISGVGKEEATQKIAEMLVNLKLVDQT